MISTSKSFQEASSDIGQQSVHSLRGTGQVVQTSEKVASAEDHVQVAGFELRTALVLHKKPALPSTKAL